MKDADKALLVFPRFDNSGGEKPDRPPLGLLTVAAPLVAAGWEVRVLDERCGADFDGTLLEELRLGPVCVGISSMSVGHLRAALRISHLVRQESRVPIVWGGVHASLAPESVLRHELVDFIVRDDGEETFPRLLEAMGKENPNFEAIEGIGYKSGGVPRMTGHSPPADITRLPPVPFHLVDLKQYESREYWTDEKQVIVMETSRGCPFLCSFCTESVRKKKWREQTPERVIADIKHYIAQYGIRSFTFIDDNLFGNIERGEQIIDLMLKEQLGIHWYTNIRSDYMARVGRAFIDKLAATGCRLLTFGAESGSPRILKMIKKASTVENVVAVNRKLAGTPIGAHFVSILGFPTETPADLRRTFQLNVRLKLDNRQSVCHLPTLIATPSTKIAEQCFGRKTDDLTLEEWITIIDDRDRQKPTWLSDDSYRMIQAHAGLRQLLEDTNRFDRSRLIVWGDRLCLRLYQVTLALGLSAPFDWLMQRLRPRAFGVLSRLGVC